MPSFVYPDELQTWSHVGIACEIALLLAALALVVASFMLRRRSGVRHGWIWGTLPLVGATGAFGFALYAHYQYWYYSTQRNAVVGPHGIATIVGTVLVLLLAMILVARWVFRGRGPAVSAHAAAPASQPA